MLHAYLSTWTLLSFCLEDFCLFFLLPLKLAISVLMFGWNVIDPNETVNKSQWYYNIRIQCRKLRRRTSGIEASSVQTCQSFSVTEIMFADRYDVKFDLFVSRSIVSGMHASLREDWSNTVSPRFRGESNTPILGERRGGEGINSTRNPVCAARAAGARAALPFKRVSRYQFGSK